MKIVVKHLAKNPWAILLLLLLYFFSFILVMDFEQAEQENITYLAKSKCVSIGGTPTDYILVKGGGPYVVCDINGVSSLIQV